MFGLSARASLLALALLPLAAGAADAANVHTLGPTAFAYSDTSVSIPVYSLTALDQPTVINCTNAAGCTVELDATVAIRQIGSTNRNLWQIMGKIDGAYFYGASAPPAKLSPTARIRRSRPSSTSTSSTASTRCRPSLFHSITMR
jgi:hypothetical protein